MNELVDGPITVHVGDALSVLRQLPSESMHCVVTSPPYWGLRDYGASGQLGLEATPELYVEHLVEVFREVRRVLRRDGTCWLNLGDSYASGEIGRHDSLTAIGTAANGKFRGGERQQYRPRSGLKPKDLIGIPWRVAFALQADGWWLRRDVIWAKPNPMPESVIDRPTSSHEYLFLLTKAATYYYDQDAIREPHVAPDRPTSGPRPERATGPQSRNGHSQWERVRSVEESHHPNGRNLRSVWTIATQPVSDAHFATYPEALVIPCIKAGTSEHGVCAECGAPWERVVERNGEAKLETTDRTKAAFLGRTHRQFSGGFAGRSSNDVGWRPTCAHDAQPIPASVLDPFAGSGTTLAVARRLGRRAVGIELQADYLPLIQKRIEGSALPLLEIL